MSFAVDTIAHNLANKFVRTENYDDISDIVPMTMWLMKTIEDVDHLSGSDKKEVVLKAVEFILDKAFSEKSDTKYVLLRELAKLVLPEIIDNIILVDKGEIRINKGVLKNFKKIWKSMKISKIMRCCSSK